MRCSLATCRRGGASTTQPPPHSNPLQLVGLVEVLRGVLVEVLMYQMEILGVELLGQRLPGRGMGRAGARGARAAREGGRPSSGREEVDS